MIKPLSTLLISTLLLTGCGQSRLNPLNWFGRDRQVTTDAAVGTINPLIPRKSPLARKKQPYQGQRIAEVTNLAIERVPGGAIIRATGLATTQGSWDVKLEPLNQGVAQDATLSFEFLALAGSKAVGTQRTRKLVVATFVTDQDIENVRNIQVVAASNARISRR